MNANRVLLVAALQDLGKSLRAVALPAAALPVSGFAASAERALPKFAAPVYRPSPAPPLGGDPSADKIQGHTWRIHAGPARMDARERIALTPIATSEHHFGTLLRHGESQRNHGVVCRWPASVRKASLSNALPTPSTRRWVSWRRRPWRSGRRICRSPWRKSRSIANPFTAPVVGAVSLFARLTVTRTYRFCI